MDPITIEPSEIGHFAQHTNLPGTPFLVSNISPPSPKSVGQLIRRLNGVPEDAEYDVLLEDTLGSRARGAIMSFLDSRANNESDFKVKITKQELCSLIGEDNMRHLCVLHPSFNTIKLRRCAAHGKCINFHLDHAKRTLQVALNGDSEYTGGQLVFATAAGLQLPQRPAGAITIHDNRIVHGVTTLESGVRYGLFLLKS
jgi:hypothetical protein